MLAASPLNSIKWRSLTGDRCLAPVCQTINQRAQLSSPSKSISTLERNLHADVPRIPQRTPDRLLEAGEQGRDGAHSQRCRARSAASTPSSSAESASRTQDLRFDQPVPSDQILGKFRKGRANTSTRRWTRMGGLRELEAPARRRPRGTPAEGAKLMRERKHEFSA